MKQHEHLESRAQRILIGEDDPSILKITRMRLEHEGYEVVTAMDGEAVVERALEDGHIALVLLDIMLPKLNGYEVCRTLKHQPGTARIPVIIFSASERNLQRLVDRCIEAGATDWIRKPFRTQDLLQKIHSALEQEEGSHD